MTFKQALRHFGSQRKMADALGVTKAAVSQWKLNNRIPLGRQFQIDNYTGGKLKAANPIRRVRYG